MLFLYFRTSGFSFLLNILPKVVSAFPFLTEARLRPPVNPHSIFLQTMLRLFPDFHTNGACIPLHGATTFVACASLGSCTHCSLTVTEKWNCLSAEKAHSKL